MRAVCVIFGLTAMGCHLVFELEDKPAATDGPLPPDTADAADDSYQATVLADDPLAFWRFGLDSQASAVDATGHGHVGVYTNIELEVGGPILREAATDRAAVFDGSSLVNVGDKFGFEGRAEFTIELWAKPGALINNAGLVSKNDEIGGTERSGWAILTVPTMMQFVLERAESGTNKQSISDDALVQGTWVHIVGTYNGDKLELFINGTTQETTTTPVIDLVKNSNAFVIGGRDGGNAIETYIGAIDEVAVYDHVLPPERIAEHHTVARLE